MAKAQRDGYAGMLKVYYILRAFGRQTALAGYHAPFDILVDEKIRMEVKTSIGHISAKHRQWQFNIHRHGRINQKETDCMILRLENLPETKSAMHLLLIPPFGKKTISIGIKHLLQGHWVQEVKDFDTFKKTGKLPAPKEQTT